MRSWGSASVSIFLLCLLSCGGGPGFEDCEEEPGETEDCTCGDGKVDPGEACDDGNTVSGDGCRGDCQKVERCGDGVVDVGEQCDGGEGCEPDCTLRPAPICGDGNVDEGEECDDGNHQDGDGCRKNCTEESCGDGIKDAGEECDDGNLVDGDGCSSACTEEAPALCGDGFLAPGEFCYASSALYDLTFSFPSRPQIRDLDGDGDLDISISLASGLYVLRNNGDGTFQSLGEVIDGDDPITHTVRWDFDGDGFLDVLESDADGGTLAVFFNDGAASFPNEVLLGGEAFFSSDYLAVGDFDGDGDQDIVATLFGDDEGLYLIRYQGGFTFSVPELLEDSSPPLIAVAAGDVEGDGDMDIVVNDKGDLILLENTGGASFQRAELPEGVLVWRGDLIFLEGGFSSELIGTPFGDFDGDGDLDQLTPASGAVAVSFYQGDGQFSTPDLYGVAGNFIENIAVGYFNVDPHLDFVVQTNQGAFVFLNDGTGQFSSAIPLPDGTRADSVGDLNGDTLSDLVGVFQGPPDGTIFVGVALSIP